MVTYLRERTVAGVVGLALALSVVGCSTPGSTPGPDDVPRAQPQTWEDTVEKTIEAAKVRGASEEQLAVLASGDISFEAYEKAVNTTASCMRSAGIDVVNDRVVDTRGFPEINYSYAAASSGRTEAETDAISQECINSNSMFIESLYRDSPAVQEVVDARFETYRASVVDCLEEAGSLVDSDLPRAELEYISTRVMIQGGKDCFYASGFY